MEKVMDNKVEIISEKEHMKEQEKLIEGFFKELHSYSADGVILTFMAILFSFVQSVFFFLPVQEWISDANDTFFFSMFFVFFVVLGYVSPYTAYASGDKKGSKTFDQLLKYMPISRKAFGRFVLKKLAKYLAKLTCVGIGLQIVVALMFVKRVEIVNICLPIAIEFFLPMLIGAFIVKSTYPSNNVSHPPASGEV